MNYLVILIVGAAAIGGYLIFDIEYQTEREVNLYTIELEIHEDMEYYQVHGGGENSKYYMKRTLGDSMETMIIKNQNPDKELVLKMLEYPSGKDVSMTFLSLNDEMNIMYFDLVMKELVLIGIAGLGIFLLTRPEKEKDIIE